MQDEVRIDVGDLLRFIRQGLIPALLLGGVLGYGAFQLANRREPVYQGQATVLAAQTNPVLREFGLSVVTAPPLDVEAYRAAGTSDPVLNSALSRMGVEEPTLSDIRQLRGDVSLQAEETRSASLIHIVGEGSVASSAANRANAVANALVDWDRARAAESVDQLVERLELQIGNLTSQIRSLQTLDNQANSEQITGLINRRAELQEQLSYARALSDAATPLLTVMQPASPPARPVAPRPMLNGLIAFCLGVVLAYGGLLLRRALNTRLTGVEDLASTTGLPVLAEFPSLGWGDKTNLREASSYLRTNLLFATPELEPKVFVITSATSGEGKTATATSLAEGFVRNGYRTLLIDADLRSPSIAKIYRIPNGRKRVSLVDWLKQPYEGHQTVDVMLGQSQTLQVVPVFQPANQPAEMLSMGFRSCLEKWRQEYDVIVIDSAPVLAVADTLAIAPLASGTVLVTHLQKTDRRQAAAAVDLLRRIGVRLLGVVASHVNPEHARRSPYGYAYGPARPEAPVDEPAGLRSEGTASRTKVASVGPARRHPRNPSG